MLSAELRKAFGMLKVPSPSATVRPKPAGRSQWPTPRIKKNAAPDTSGKGLAGLKYKVLDEAGDEIEGRTARAKDSSPSWDPQRDGLLLRHGGRNQRRDPLGTWLYTGDLARIDPGDGDEMQITFLGRKEDYLRTNGEVIPADSV